MFTVCPKCALTLVVTAADLRVAQGYVRCGRCSNVFNAIVGLSEDRGGGSAQGSSATTSTIRKAPSIDQDEPPHDALSDTGETEAVYAEPQLDAQEVTFQEVFIEAPQPAPPPQPASQKPAVPPRSPAPASAPPQPPKSPPPPMPEFSDSIPDIALEFNPNEMDVSKVFIEAAPVKIDLRQITGTFEQTVQLPEDEPPPPQQPVSRPHPPAPRREQEDAELEEELRTLAARLDATGKQPALSPEPAAQSPAAKPAAPKRAASEDVLVYGDSYTGSPYNSADDPANKARKAAAETARRNLANPPISERPVIADDQEFDAPPADDAGAYAAAGLMPRPMSRRKRLAWIGGSVALALLLAAQYINHNRHDLATSPVLNRPLTRFYGAIGVPLVPRWNLASYDVRQLGAFSGAGDSGNLTVRASLKNTANQPLPLPLLRITVQDRYGNRIATRDVPPKSYVPGAVPEGAHLGVGQRIDAEMSFKDPGRDAVGFEIDACLPTPEGRIACANDAAVTAAR